MVIPIWNYLGWSLGSFNIITNSVQDPRGTITLMEKGEPWNLENELSKTLTALANRKAIFDHEHNHINACWCSRAVGNSHGFAHRQDVTVFCIPGYSGDSRPYSYLLYMGSTWINMDIAYHDSIDVGVVMGSFYPPFKYGKGTHNSWRG